MSESRRSFLKKTIAAAAILPAVGTSSLFASNNLNEFSNDELLNNFETWVDEYVIEIHKEKELSREFKDNTALVDLPAQMEKMMPHFKSRFDQPDFLKKYLQISRKLSKAVDPNF